MNTTLEGNNLVIRIPLNSTPLPSKTGKTLLVATTHGLVKTDVLVGGKQLTISVNAMVPNQ